MCSKRNNARSSHLQSRLPTHAALPDAERKVTSILAFEPRFETSRSPRCGVPESFAHSKRGLKERGVQY